MKHILGNMKIGNKMILIIVSVFVVFNTIQIKIIFNRCESIHTKIAYQSLDNLTQCNVKDLKAKFDKKAEVVRSLAYTMQNYELFIKNDRREILNSILRSSVEANPDVISIWTCWEPNALDGLDAQYANKPGYDKTGRFAPSWSRSDNKLMFKPVAYNNMEGIGYYYKSTIETGAEFFVEPHPFINHKGEEISISTISTPIKVDGKCIGAVGITFDIQAIQKEVEAIKPFGNGVSVLISNQGSIVAHGLDPTRIGKKFTQTETYLSEEHMLAVQNTINTNKFTTFTSKSDIIGDFKVYVEPFTVDKINTPWALAISIPIEAILKDLNNLRILAWIVGIINGLLICLVVYLIASNISMYIKLAVDLFKSMADGDLKHQIPDKYSHVFQQKDEVGVLCKAGIILRDKMHEVIEEVAVGVDSLITASSQLNDGSQAVSQGSTEQAANVEEVSSSMEQMVANIQQNTDNAQQANVVTEKVSKEIRNVNSAANDSLQSIREIAGKIDVINDISFQTNLLALNAAVEAARAGEQGRGFAVVAAEVRRLAERSKIAAEEIVGLASKCVHVTELSSQLLDGIVPQIEKSAQFVQEITSASVEQRSGAEQVNNAIQQMNSVTQQNAATSEGMATAAEELTAQAESLKEVVGFFKINDEVKKKSIRTQNSLNSVKHVDTPARHVPKGPSVVHEKKTKGVNLNLNDDSLYEKY